VTTAAARTDRDRGPRTGTVTDEVWDAYVAAHPHRSAYHYSGWPRLIARAFGHDVVLLAALDGEKVVGVLPLVVMRSRIFGRFVVSLPFLNDGGLLADDEMAEASLIEAGIAVARRSGAEYLELRHRRRHSTALSERSHKVAMTLALRQTVDEQWQAVDRKVRNQVRKAEKSGVTVESGGDELVPAFYEVFARNMRDLGTPVFGVGLFAESLRAFPERTRIFLARHRGAVVAGSIAHWRGGSIEVIWASALRESNSVSANVLLYWHLIQFAIVHGCDRFEFGRCTPNEGPFQFKKQWGAEPSPLVWEYWHAGPIGDIDKTPRNPKYRAAVAVWQRLPVGLTRIVGPRIVRSIPC
jgi:FemAB-related protein (PEP-CTERM system-associated)